MVWKEHFSLYSGERLKDIDQHISDNFNFNGTIPILAKRI